MKTKMLIKFLILECILLLFIAIILSKQLIPEIAKYISITSMNIISVTEHIAYWFAFIVYATIILVAQWAAIGLGVHYLRYGDI
jgi:hypothetical protein